MANGSKIRKSRFFSLENWQSAESWYRLNNILLVYSTFFFLQFTCQNITHLSMLSHRAFMIYKYTYHGCEKNVAQDSFY